MAERDPKLSDSEIIRTLAEKCMGCEVIVRRNSPQHNACIRHDGPKFFAVWDSKGVSLCGMDIPLDWAGRYWNPLSSISDAFMVVEKMRERIPYQAETQTFSFQLCQTGIPGKWFCSFVTNPGDWSTQARVDDADSPARAICFAAIAALEER